MRCQGSSPLQTNDLLGVMLHVKRVLKPDGVFIASLFGEETLYELRFNFAFTYRSSVAYIAL